MCTETDALSWPLQGVTRAFILEGVDVAGRTLGGEAATVLNQSNFDYVNRWNAERGRHEVRLGGLLCGYRYIDCSSADVVPMLPRRPT